MSTRPKLWKDGALTDAEFEAQKARLLEGVSEPVVEHEDWEDWEEPKRNKILTFTLWALAIIGIGGAGGLAYSYISDTNQSVSSLLMDGIDSSPSSTAPDELKSSIWVKASEGCAEDSWRYQFADGYYLNMFDGRISFQEVVSYVVTDNGWDVIKNDGIDRYQKSGDRIEFLGRDVEGVLIRPSRKSVLFQQCSADTLFEPLSDVPPRPKPKTPLNGGLWLAIMWNDVEAAEKLAMRIPNLQGSTILSGDPNEGPDLDTMLSLNTTSREVYLAIQRVLGQNLAGNPEDKYAVEGQPWKNVSAFPIDMQADFASGFGCGTPLRFTSNSRIFNPDGSTTSPKSTDVAKRIAVSGNRVLMTQNDDISVIYEMHPDGSLTQLTLLMKSGAPLANNKAVNRERCSPMETLSNSDVTEAASQDIDRSRPARLIGSQHDWINMSDYPPNALREGRTGIAKVVWDVDTTGRISNCQITESSGHADLDEATCKYIQSRARYNPATDNTGMPIRSTGYGVNFHWDIPD